MYNVGYIILVVLRYLISLVMVILIIMFLTMSNRKKNDRSSENKDSIASKNIRPDVVLVPDNVKKVAQDMSTQNVDAKLYNVKFEKSLLEQKGYKKDKNSNEYIKTEVNNSSYLDNKEDKDDPIKNIKKEINTFDNNEEDEDPIKGD